MREPLRHRGFRLLFLAQCASYLGDAVFLIAIAFAVLEVSGSAAALGTVLAIGGAFLVAAFLVSGVWADRLPRVRLMIASDLVRIGTQSLLAALLLTGRADVLVIAALYAVYSVATAFFQPARTALTPQLLEPRLLMSGNGVMSTAENTMWLLGWAVGGALVAAVGPGWAIALDAVSFAVSAALLACIGRVPATSASAARQPFLQELAAGWREVRSRRWLWYVVLGFTIFLTVYEAPLQVVGPLIASDAYDGARSWGILLCGAAAGSIAGALIAATDRLRRPMLVSLSLAFGCVAMPLLLLVTAPLWVLFACNVVVGLAFGLFDTVWDSALQRGVPADKVARVSAWDWMGSLAGMPLGFAACGVLVEGIGRDATLVGMSIATFAVCLALVSDREVRQLGMKLGGGAGRAEPRG